MQARCADVVFLSEGRNNQNNWRSSRGRAMRAPTPRFDIFRTIAKESHALLYSELDVISTKWSEAERVEKSPSSTQHCSLSGRFLDYSLTRIRLAATARNDIWRKCADCAKQRNISDITSRGLHCKPAVPTLFFCPRVEIIRTIGAAAADAQCAPLHC